MWVGLLSMHVTHHDVMPQGRVEVAVVGEKSSAFLQTVNYNGAPCEESIQSLQYELVSEISCATVLVRGSLERRKQSL